MNELKTAILERLTAWDWQTIKQNLNEDGFAKTPRLLDPEECEGATRLYNRPGLFRSRINMEQYNFGRGEYKYFAYPLPPLVDELRTAFYPLLAPIANSWLEKLGRPAPYPATLDRFLADCHAAGQTKPTPLILRYEAGGYNCLHQDLYGEIAFPLQVVIVLNQAGTDFGGGELLLIEQRPRAQSRGQVITLEKGSGLIFTNRFRPVASRAGHYRVNVRHGVSRVEWGIRYSLGLVFHDAT